MSDFDLRETHGERKVKSLLKALPENDFLFQYEMRISLKDNRGVSKPDFVIAIRYKGIIVLEVKDWVKLEGGDTHSITITRRNGEKAQERNPIRVADGYAYDLKERLEQRVELRKYHRGKISLKFPWMAAVVLPNISQSVIRQFETQGIWDCGVVLGKELLESPETFKRALENLPSRWKLDEPMSMGVFNEIRGVIDPIFNKVTDIQGNDIGTTTPTQESIIKEREPALEPRQRMLFADEEFSSEAERIANDQNVRLVRGVAGSGKTLVLMYRARYLHENYPDSKILVLTFNKDLAAYLSGRFPDITVTHFHKFCAEVMGKRWKSPNNLEGYLNRFMVDKISRLGLTIKFVIEEFMWRKDMELFTSWTTELNLK